jgi:hypothetical protein
MNHPTKLLKGSKATNKLALNLASSEESVGHWYGRMLPGSSARVAGEPAAGWLRRRLFFVTSCLSNQFDLGKHYAVCRYEPALLAKLASLHVHEYGSDDLVKTSSGIDLVIR